MRTRSKGTITSSQSVSNNPIPSVWTAPAETMTESSYPGSCNVTHFKVLQTFSASGTLVSSPTTTINWNNVVGLTPTIHAPVSLNWGRLPTSNRSGIIQILAEIDKTISLFTLKSLRNLSYGSVTWGFMPFFTDLIEVCRIVRNLTVDLSDFDYEDQTQDTKDFRVVDTYGDIWSGTVEVVRRVSGKADISPSSDLDIWLDRVGFHPDLATAWDLIPYSFVVDYILPIGDFLESMRGGGWVKSAYVSGWYTQKATINGKWQANPSVVAGATGSYSNQLFVRSGVSEVIVADTSPDLTLLRAPSLRQIFNMIWLFAQQRSRNSRPLLIL